MGDFWRKLLLYFEWDTPRDKQCDEESLLIKEAFLDWQAAQRYYQVVCDPYLVEYAIFAIKAAEIKYCYLIKQARQHGLYVYPVTGQSGYCRRENGSGQAAERDAAPLLR